VGNTTDDMLKLPLEDARARSRAMELFAGYPTCGYFVRGWPNAVYVGVFLGESNMFRMSVPFKSVALYRLSPISKDYQLLSPILRHAWPRITAKDLSNRSAEEDSETLGEDFLVFILYDPKHNPGFKYELIYSDPPAK